ETYTNFETIVIDDGSEDLTTEIINRTASNVRIIHQENKGTMAARQTGIDASSGELIAFIDQDDLWNKYFLYTQVNHLIKHPQVGLIFSNMEAIDDKGNKLGFNVIPKTDTYITSWESFLLINPISKSTCVIRKEVLNLIGELDANFGHSGALGDTDMFVRASEVTEVHYIDRILGSYRWSEMRPGRLLSFIDNLVIYCNKYWDHPKLLGDENYELKIKFVESCSAYAIHIFRLLLEQNQNEISVDLLKKLNNHHHKMILLFGSLYEKIVGLKPFFLEIYNTENTSFSTFLYIYLLRKDLQSKFPSVAWGDIKSYLNWAQEVVHDNLKDYDSDILIEHGNKLFSDTIDINHDHYKDVEFPKPENPIGAIVLTIRWDKNIAFDLLYNIYHCLVYSKYAFRLYILLSAEDEHNFNRIKNAFCVPCSSVELNEIDKYEKILNLITTEEYVIFINNSLIFDQQYFDNLISNFPSDKNLGVVTGKIINYENNKILHTGGTITPDSKVFFYGAGSEPRSPEFSYSRSVDIAFDGSYCVRLKQLNEIFINHLEFKSYVNYFKNIQNFGYKIQFQPEAIAFSKQKDSSWSDSSNSIFSPSSMKEKLMLRNIDRPIQILAIDDYIPAVRFGSGYPRLYELLNILAELGYAVTYVPVGNSVKAQPETKELQQKGIEVFYHPFVDFPTLIEERKSCYDVVLISRPHVFSKHFSTIRAKFPKAGIIYDAEALYYRREQLRNDVLGTEISQNATENKQEEMRMIESADVVLAVSDYEKEEMLKNSRQENVEVWGHVREIIESSTKYDTRKDLLFIGSFFAGPGSPNEDAALYFSNEVFPLIKELVDCKLYIVGSYPTEAVNNIESSEIIVTGYVDNLSDYFGSCRVNVVPTRFAAGIPLKLIEAMSHGMPTVTTPMIAGQLGLKDYEHVLIAESPVEFAKKVVQLYSDCVLWEKIRSNSFAFVKEHFSKIVMKEALAKIMKKSLDCSDNKY
ncbi:MAG TPA: hypothetical protein DCX03_05505, partial [Bacteroidales bacterium]|nr:hypothetical protein [Bacteroidales bacterium]